MWWCQLQYKWQTAANNAGWYGMFFFPSVKFILTTFQTYSGVPTYAIVCNQTSRLSPYQHFCHVLKPGIKPVNFQLLEALIKSGYHGQIEQCYPTWPIASRSTSCGKFSITFQYGIDSKLILNWLGISHPQGSGKIMKLSCGVLFDILIPEDLDKMPWIIWCSRGIHTHNPPPPTQTPQELLTDLVSVISRLSVSVRNVCKLFWNRF